MDKNTHALLTREYHAWLRVPQNQSRTFYKCERRLRHFLHIRPNMVRASEAKFDLGVKQNGLGFFEMSSDQLLHNSLEELIDLERYESLPLFFADIRAGHVTLPKRLHNTFPLFA